MFLPFHVSPAALAGVKHLAAIGHNLPPTDAEILDQKLQENNTETLARILALSGREIPASVTSDEQAGVLTDYIKALGGSAKDIDEIHKREKKPYLDAGRVVDAFKNRYTDMLDAAKKRATAPLEAFLKEKARLERERLLEVARLERERAEALAAEAEAHQAENIPETANALMDAAVAHDEKGMGIEQYALTAKSADMAKVRGAGSVASMRTVWTGEIESIGAVDLEPLRHFFKPEEVQGAVDRFVKNGGRELRGVRI